MRVLGLDPSLSAYGWCIHDTERTGADSVVDRGLFMTGSRWLEIRRYLHLRACLREVVLHYKPSVAGLETPYFGGEYSEGLYALFVVNQEVMFRFGVDTVYFAPSQLKKLASKDATGKRKMFKSDMISEAKKDTGIKLWNNNEADAYHAGFNAGRFWHLVRGQISEGDLTPAEDRVFINRHTFKRGAKAGITEENGIFFKKNKRWFTFSEVKQSYGN